MRLSFLAALLAPLVLCFGPTSFSEEKPPTAAKPAAPDKPRAKPEKPSVFDLPRLQMGRALTGRATSALFAKGEYATAEKVLRQAVERLPHDFNAQYNLACALARQGKKDEALEALAKAVELGFRDPDHIRQDEDLASLRGEGRFNKAIEAAGEPLTEQPTPWRYQVKPAPVVGGVAMVGEENTAWNPRLGVFQVFFRFEEKPSDGAAVCKGYGKTGDLLRQWYEEGSAAGNHGDLYDNHDTDHSNMNFKAFPQLARIEFSEEAKKRRLNHGLQTSFLYNGVTIGNSSTALTRGPFWRSQGRHALTQPRAAALLYVQYVGRHLYIYPEHRDYDPGPSGENKKGRGDVLPANTPYMILSQGSSGSDRVFLDAVAATLAAFRPEVKQQLAKSGLLMPAVQMIFRSSNKQVEKPADYLTGKAHPPVFDGKNLDPARMVTLAHEMTADALPPMVQLKVVEEDEGVVGRDYFDTAPRERFLDTPCAIARVVKSSKYARRMVVSAEASKDVKGKPLSYHWVVLQGDAARIEINKKNESGAIVELIVPYHERRPIAPGSDMESSRVDIGAFVHNGTYYSAPAFVSLYYLDNEKRVYDEQRRIRSIDYTDPEMKDNYVDPVLDLKKDWRDEYRYSDDGKLLGWTRIRGEAREEFTAEGRLILEKDDQGNPTKTAEVRYAAKPRPGKAPLLEQQVVEQEPAAEPRQSKTRS